MQPIKNPEVAAVLEGYPPKFRQKLLALRELILETARSTEGVGPIEETLKWGEPAYVTSESNTRSEAPFDTGMDAPPSSRGA